MNKASNVKEVNFQGSALTNPADISEAFYSYFPTIGEKLANEIPSSTVGPISYISPTDSVFTFEEIVISTVDHLLGKINNNKATGLYGIPGKLLNMAASMLSSSLTQMLKKSPIKRIYSKDWKTGADPGRGERGSSHGQIFSTLEYFALTFLKPLD